VQQRDGLGNDIVFFVSCDKIIGKVSTDVVRRSEWRDTLAMEGNTHEVNGRARCTGMDEK
jgi:hypothetical protein